MIRSTGNKERRMKSIKSLFSGAPEGAAALFFIQIFATLGFAVFYSTLVLYATKHLHLSTKEATALMGVFGAFNYGLHLFGGYLGGRFLSNRNLFVGGMALQVIGCACVAVGTLATFYLGLGLFLTWQTLADRNTMLLDVTPKQFRMRQIAGILIVIGLVPIVWFMLQRPGNTGTFIKGICALVALTLIFLTLRHSDRRERRNMTAYLILTLGSLMFWSLYQMAPNGLTLFAANNVDLMVGSFQIQPQWILNINTVVIFLGGPILASFLPRIRARGWRIDIPQQFAASLLLMSLAFLILPVGIKLAGGDGKSAFVWLFLSYVLQSFGELLISPIGYAMIGKLAPKQYQGVMMGSWMLVTGLASLFASDFSGMIPEPTGATAVETNAGYAKLFAQLGAGSLAVGVALVILNPFLRKLITDKAEAPVLETPVPVGPVA